MVAYNYYIQYVHDIVYYIYRNLSKESILKLTRIFLFVDIYLCEEEESLL